jgi:hypothetical protein
MTSFGTRFLGKEKLSDNFFAHTQANKTCQGKIARLYRPGHNSLKIFIESVFDPQGRNSCLGEPAYSVYELRAVIKSLIGFLHVMTFLCTFIHCALAETVLFYNDLNVIAD